METIRGNVVQPHPRIVQADPPFRVWEFQLRASDRVVAVIAGEWFAGRLFDEQVVTVSGTNNAHEGRNVVEANTIIIDSSGARFERNPSGQRGPRITVTGTVVAPVSLDFPQERSWAFELRTDPPVQYFSVVARAETFHAPIVGGNTLRVEGRPDPGGVLEAVEIADLTAGTTILRGGRAGSRRLWGAWVLVAIALLFSIVPWLVIDRTEISMLAFSVVWTILCVGAAVSAITKFFRVGRRVD